MSKRKNGGFTLIELVVVLAVIAIMSAVGASLVTGTSSIRADSEDKIAIVEMNNIFTEVWGSESYAHPQTAADIRAVLASHGYEWREPRAQGSEWWFGLNDGQMHIGKVEGDKLNLDYGNRIDLVPNNEIITADGVLPDYLYMGSMYKKLIDDFNALDVGFDGSGSVAEYAVGRLNALLGDEEYPFFMRKSLSTLASHSLFVGAAESVGFEVLSSDDAEAIPTFTSRNAEEDSIDDRTIILFMGERSDTLEIELKDQLRGCFAKSVYIPSDVNITSIGDGALDGSWIQRLLINGDMPALTENEIINKDIENDSPYVVSVLKKYYPSELPAYEMDERRIDKFLKLYSGHKSSSNGFTEYEDNELLSSDNINALYSGFYSLRPFERKFVTTCYDLYPSYGLDRDEPIYENINRMHSTSVMLNTLYNKVKKLSADKTELLLGQHHSLYDRLATITAIDSFTGVEHNAMGERGKLFVGSMASSDDSVLEVNEVGDVVTRSRGEANVKLCGVLKDDMNVAYMVCGPYEGITLKYADIGGRRFALRSDGKGGYEATPDEVYGTLCYDLSTRRISAQKLNLGVEFIGEFIHSSERPEVVPSNASYDIGNVASTGELSLEAGDGNGAVNISVSITSALNPKVGTKFSIKLAGNTCNLFGSEEFEGVNKDSCGLAFHTDITSNSTKTWTVPLGKVVYGNGYTFTNTAKGAENSIWAQNNGEFRFPAVVTVYGTVKNLKMIAKKGDALGLSNRFVAIATAESGETESTLANLKMVQYTKGNISGSSWSGTGQYKGLLADNNKGKSYGPIELLSKRLAAVRVYGSGKIYNCIVEGGQYGIHIVGSATVSNANNLDKVVIKNSLDANLYISDNEGAMQNISIKDVHTYNDNTMSAAFPMLIEPKIAAVSAKKEGMDRVLGYGICLKYYYGLIENKLNVNIDGLFVYNKISQQDYYNMLRDSVVNNVAIITDRVRGMGNHGELNLFKDNFNDIVNKLDLGKSFSVPITYGEQTYIQMYDQQCVVADTGMRKSVASQKNVKTRSGFDSLIKGYNGCYRAARGVDAGGTNEVSISYYAIPTKDGGTWNDANLDIRSGMGF